MKSNVLLFLICFSSVAEAQYFNFVSFNKDEVASLFIYDIAQNQRGELYFATEEGLVIFDGLTFDVLNTEDSLRYNFVSKVLIDYQSTIWIAYNNGGISKIENDVLIHYPVQFNVLEMEEVSDGQIIMITDEGAFLYSANNHVRIPAFDDLIGLHAWEKDALIALDQNGSLTVRRRDKSPVIIKEQVSHFSVDSQHQLIATISENALIVSKKIENQPFEELLRIDLEDFIREEEISAFELKGNELLIGLVDKGIRTFSFNYKAQTFTTLTYNKEKGMVSDNIRSVFSDKQGNQWIGTYGKGISYLPKNKIITYSNRKSQLQNNILCLATFENQLFIGSDQGFYAFSETGLSTAYLEGMKITSMHSTADVLWIATDKNGLFQYKNKATRPFLFKNGSNQPSRINCLAFSDQKIYAGTNEGLYINNLLTNESKLLTTNEGLAHNVIENLLIDSKRRIWFDSPNSPIYMLDMDKEQFTYFRELRAFASYNLADMLELNDGSILFGTNGDGIFIYKNGTFSNYTQAEGLRSNYTDFIAKNENGLIYLGHQFGLSVQKKSDSITSFKSTRSIGQLRAINSNCALSQNKSDLWIGTPSGLVHILNVDQYENEPIPELFITGLVINNEDLRPANLKPLNYGNYFIKFEFKSVCIGLEDEIEYEYILEGFDKNWTRVSGIKRQAIYQSLKDGEYRFKVRLLKNGIVQGESKNLALTISRPIWKTALFYIIILFVLMALFLYILYIVNRKNSQLRKKLAKKVQERTQEIQSKNETIKQINSNLERLSYEYLAAKELAEKKTDEMEQSIRYAKQIQKVTFRKNEYTDWIKMFHDFYLIFKPKDIVSGDFYWGAKNETHIYVAVGDCTGHGVPGALIGMLGVSILNDIVPFNTNTNDILNKLRSRIIVELGQNLDDSQLYDGIDIALIKFDLNTKILQVSSAYSPVFIVRKIDDLKDYHHVGLKELDRTEELVLLSTVPDRQPAGYHSNMTDFTATEFQLYEGDQLYLFSDGYADQFGGENNKKLMKRRFIKTLLQIYEMNGDDQKEFLWANLKNWQGLNEQVDDISIIGLKIK